MHTPAFPRPFRLGLVAALLALAPGAVAFTWNGAGGSGFAAQTSWYGPAPVPKTVNYGDLILANGDASPLEYTAAEGQTAFQSAEFKIGNSNHPGGSLLVKGGELVIHARQSPIVGQNNGRPSRLTVTGGRLIVSNTDQTPERERIFRVGNGADRTLGVLEISGGEVVINCPGTEKDPGFVIASGPASGWVHLMGGVLRITSPHGSGFQPINGGGVGILTIGQGDGQFIQTASKTIVFGTGRRGIENYIDFESGSEGLLSLAGATQADFEAMVSTGRIRIDNQRATPDKFTFSFENGQGIYRLATAAK